MKNIKRTIITIVFLAVAVTGAIQSFGQNNVPEENEKVLQLVPDDTENGKLCMGDFIKLNDGRLLFCYSEFIYSNDFFKHNNFGVIKGRFSDDGGQTWDKESRVILKNEYGEGTIMCPGFIPVKEGIALTYSHKKSDSYLISMMHTSYDDGESWEKPTVCQKDTGYYPVLNQGVIRLKSGRLLMPVALHKTPQDSVFNWWGKIFCYYSDDEGQSWTANKKLVPNPDHVLLQEPRLIELQNGNIAMYMRTDVRKQYISVSKDQGETWSEVAPSNINSPRSPMSVKRIPSTGDLLLVWNNNKTKEIRTPLNIAISKDEGKTWEKVKTLEDDPEGRFCYTSIFFIDDYVLIAYNNTGISKSKANMGGIAIRRISLDWIYQ